MTKAFFVLMFYFALRHLPSSANVEKGLVEVDQCDEDAVTANASTILQCSSDCFMHRFAVSDVVFLGYRRSGDTAIGCWLKRPWDMKEYSTAFRAPSATCGSTSVPDLSRGRWQVVFANHIDSSPGMMYSLTAKSVVVEHQETWNEIRTFCGIRMARPTHTVKESPYTCCPLGGSCNETLSIAYVESLGGSPTTPAATLTTTAVNPKQCTESCIYETCNSNCLMTRYSSSDHVFWGIFRDSKVEPNRVIPVDIFCWLKTESLVPPSQVSVETWLNETSLMTPRCWDVISVDDHVQGLFFVDSEFKLTIAPVRVSSYLAWQRVTSLCNLTSTKITGTSNPPPFGHCIAQDDTAMGGCYEDVSVESVESLSRPCPGSYDSLSSRFTPDTAVTMGHLNNVGQNQESSGYVATVDNSCTWANSPEEWPSTFELTQQSLPLFNEGYRFQFICSPKDSDICFDFDYISVDLPPGQKCVLGITEMGSEKRLATQPIQVNSSDAEAALSRLCTIWRRNMSRCDVADPYAAGKGCFFDLSAKALEDPNFSLSDDALQCSRVAPDSFFGRMSTSGFAVYGAVNKIDYLKRQITISIECILKNDSNLTPREMSLTVPIELDGCFGVDHNSVRLKEKFIFFYNATTTAAMREVPITSIDQLPLYASVCGTLATKGSCRSAVDRRYGCYSDLSIQSISQGKTEPEDLPPLRLRTDCCEGMTSVFDSATYSRAYQVLWGTLSDIITLTSSHESSNGNQLLALDVRVQCEVNWNAIADDNIGILTDLASLLVPFHKENAYIFVIRKIENSPWPLVEYETITPPILATKKNWQRLCEVCDVRAKSNSCRPNGMRCGDCKACYNAQYNRPPGTNCPNEVFLNESAVYCSVAADDLTSRIDSGSEDVAVVWGEALAVASTSLVIPPTKANESIPLAVPLSSPPESFSVIQLSISPYCQLRGHAFDGNQTLISYGVDCFHDVQSSFLPGLDYLLFVANNSQRMTAPGLLADNETIVIIANSCDINPPSEAVFPPYQYAAICPTSPPDPSNCDQLIHLSNITPPEPTTVSVPSDLSTSTFTFPIESPNPLEWWEILLITIGVLVLTLLATLCACYFLKILNRNQVSVSEVRMSAVGSQTRGVHFPLPQDDDDADPFQD